MARYRALSKTWLSHENRMVQDGEEFETEFPLVGGKPMRIGANLELIEPEQVAPAPAPGKGLTKAQQAAAQAALAAAQNSESSQGDNPGENLV